MASVELQQVHKAFAGGHIAVAGVDLHVRDGECVAVVGPSGCGKSTVLRLVAGLETPSSGRVLIDGADVTSTAPQQRDLAMVFQNYALYPHMTVRDNLSYGLRTRRTPRAEIEARVRHVADALELGSLLDRKPAQLSGGQRQRVALGRAMVRQPRAFLLDEPLSNLDPELRAQSRAELLRLQRTLGATVIYVTHDQEEAMTLGHRVAVMRQGRIEQVAPPLDAYHQPSNLFVARFIGSPPMNVLSAGQARITNPGAVSAGIRPQDVVLDDAGDLTAVVDVVESRGPDSVVHLRLHDREPVTILAVVRGTPPPIAASVRLRLPPDRVHLFDSAGRRVDG